MSYSVCGLIVLQAEASICSKLNCPYVALAGGVSLIPLNRAYLFLVDGDTTPTSEHVDFIIAEWLGKLLAHFTRAAYVEAEFWGGSGMQASFVWENGNITFGPEVSSGAINVALRRLGIQEKLPGGLYGLPLIPDKDPFDIIGLGRHRTVEGWLRECAKVDQ